MEKVKIIEIKLKLANFAGPQILYCNGHCLFTQKVSFCDSYKKKLRKNIQKLISKVC